MPCDAHVNRREPDVEREKRVFVWKRVSEAENASIGRSIIPGDYCRFTGLPDGRVMYNGQGGRGGLLFISRNEFRDEPSQWELLQPKFDRPIKWLYELRFLPDGTWGMFGTWEQDP